jgi:hypothetical protein
MNSSYVPGRAVSEAPRTLWTYLGGAAAARAGDEMSGPAVLLLGLAVAGPLAGRSVTACLLVAAAVEVCAAAAYLLAGLPRARQAPHGGRAVTPRTVRNKAREFR